MVSQVIVSHITFCVCKQIHDTNVVVVADEIGVLLGRWEGYRGESGYSLQYSSTAFWLIGEYTVNNQKKRWEYRIHLHIPSTTPLDATHCIPGNCCFLQQADSKWIQFLIWNIKMTKYTKLQRTHLAELMCWNGLEMVRLNQTITSWLLHAMSIAPGCLPVGALCHLKTLDSQVSDLHHCLCWS